MNIYNELINFLKIFLIGLFYYLVGREDEKMNSHTGLIILIIYFISLIIVRHILLGL